MMLAHEFRSQQQLVGRSIDCLLSDWTARNLNRAWAKIKDGSWNCWAVPFCPSFGSLSLLRFCPIRVSAAVHGSQGTDLVLSLIHMDRVLTYVHRYNRGCLLPVGGRLTNRFQGPVMGYLKSISNSRMCNLLFTNSDSFCETLNICSSFNVIVKLFLLLFRG